MWLSTGLVLDNEGLASRTKWDDQLYELEIPKILNEEPVLVKQVQK